MKYDDSEIGPAARSWEDEGMKGPALIKVGPSGPHRVGLHIVLLIGEHFSKIYKYNIYFFWISNKRRSINEEETTYNTQEERGKKEM